MKIVALINYLCVSALSLALCGNPCAAEPFRPPAVPLVTFDPYLSIWSGADRLTGAPTKHWTGQAHPLCSLLRVDGKSYRLMGGEPNDVPALPQQSVAVFPTRSIYEFENEHVHVRLTFMTAALPNDLETFAQPLSYLTWQVSSVDGQTHSVQLFDSTSSLICVNDDGQAVKWDRETAGPLTVMRVGTQAQAILKRAGDHTRIDWGYAYVAARADQATAAIGAQAVVAKQFTQNGTLPPSDDARMPRAPKDAEPVLAFAFDLGAVSALPLTRQVVVAYDEIDAISYFGTPLRPYWRRNGATPEEMLQSAFTSFPDREARCEAFDRDLVADLTKVGGPKYATVAALAYRQCAAACGLAADAKGQPLFFTKENTSNGDIATVDVIFPMDPIWIFLSPTLAKASLVSVLDYGASDRWTFPCSPHDLGTYPIARGTDNGGEAMPVEESGNVLILIDAIARAEGNADFATRWWPTLTKWAQYLEQFGLDPADQLCTDDFMGHLAHNANLSIKAILGLAAYGDLCRLRGDTASADRYAALAKTDSIHWMQIADAGDHSLLAFDKPGTWSQKYNLVWDRILGLNVFPPQIAQREIELYKHKAEGFGVPLDSRTKITKTDWTFWCATLADNLADFDQLIAPVYDYLNQTTTRDPLADSYDTTNYHSGGMHARPVVGGLFIKMLADPAVWKGWASKDTQKVGDWAPLPPRPTFTEVVPSSKLAPVIWRYTTQTPDKNWFQSDFNDSSWKTGPGGFGSKGTPHAVVRTEWTDTPGDIWLRRSFTFPDAKIPAGLQLYVFHDEDAEIYINGVLAKSERGFLKDYETSDLSDAARTAMIASSPNVLAVHCHQTEAGQYIDVGLATIQLPTTSVANDRVTK